MVQNSCYGFEGARTKPLSTSFSSEKIDERCQSDGGVFICTLTEPKAANSRLIKLIVRCTCFSRKKNQCADRKGGGEVLTEKNFIPSLCRA